MIPTSATSQKLEKEKTLVGSRLCDMSCEETSPSKELQVQKGRQSMYDMRRQDQMGKPMEVG
jgi:hypothetical protein